jgi:hypothetical protein
MSKAEAQADVKKMHQLMEDHIDIIKADLVTVEAIFRPLETFHTKNKFKIISKLFCDGLGITDIVFKTFPEFESFFAERGVHIFVSLRSWTTKNELL